MQQRLKKEFSHKDKMSVSDGGGGGVGTVTAFQRTESRRLILCLTEKRLAINT